MDVPADANNRSTLAVVVSPRQAALGTFFGGPVALIYFLRKNYLCIGNVRSAKRTLLFGSVLVLAWNVVTVLDVVLPKAASYPLGFALEVTPFASAIVARYFVQHQLASAPRMHEFCSNWSAAGTAVLCLFTSTFCLLPAIVAVTVYTYVHMQWRV